jgi:biopolymer transport protein ExbB/TolQ
VQQIGYYLTHPDAIIYAVASILLYPVLITEIFALLYIAYQTGVWAFEGFIRFRARRKRPTLAQLAEKLRAGLSHAEAGATDTALAYFDYGRVLPVVTEGLADGDWSRLHIMKLLSDAEHRAARLLDRTRVFIRIGPILGLMGTLIPISPALVGLASGNVDALSANLVIAFSTTVVGLLIGGAGYLLSLSRERMYSQDLRDLEYVFEKAGV